MQKQKKEEKTLKRLARLDKFQLSVGMIGKQDWSGTKTAFIVSTGRTGTKFLVHFFKQIDGIHAVHEPRPNLLNFAITYSRGKHSVEQAERFIEKNRRTALLDTERRNCDTYIESNNRYFSLLQPLRMAFPNGKIVYIVRDGRDYARSGMARKWYTWRDYKKRETALMYPDDPYYSEWKNMSRFDKICWRWQKKDGFTADDFDLLKGPKLKLTFESMFKTSDKAGLYQLAQFLEISDSKTSELINEMGSNKVNKNDTVVEEIGPWSEWSDERKRSFDRIASHHMRRHYEDYTPMITE